MTQKLVCPKNLFKVIREEFGVFYKPHCLGKKFLYKGDIVEGCRHGYGKLYFGNQLKSIKDPENPDQNRGINKKKHKNQAVEENCGYLDDNNGRNSVIQPRFVYEGNFLLDAIHDKKAKIYNANGSLYYEGPIFLGRKEGYGTLYHASGHLQYRGYWNLSEKI